MVGRKGGKGSHGSGSLSLCEDICKPCQKGSAQARDVCAPGDPWLLYLCSSFFPENGHGTGRYGLAPGHGGGADSLCPLGDPRKSDCLCQAEGAGVPEERCAFSVPVPCIAQKCAAVRASEDPDAAADAEPVCPGVRQNDFFCGTLASVPLFSLLRGGAQPFGGKYYDAALWLREAGGETTGNGGKGDIRPGGTAGAYGSVRLPERGIQLADA